MPLKLHVNGFKQIENTSQFYENIKSYINDSDEKFFLEVDVQYPEEFHQLHYALPFLPKIIKIEKVQKIVANLLDKKEYVVQMRNQKFKTSIKSWVSLEKMHRVIKFNQKT